MSPPCYTGASLKTGGGSAAALSPPPALWAGPSSRSGARGRSQSRSLPALLVIPAAASFAHELPTAPGVGF